MLCRLLLGALFLLYLICVLVLSGVQKEDLEVGLLTKLEHYNINISDAIHNVTVLEECISRANHAHNSSNDTNKHITKLTTRSPERLSTNKPVSKETHDVIEIDLDSEPIESNYEFSNVTRPKVHHHNIIKPKSIQDILKLWESYVKASSGDNDDNSNEILEIETTNQPEVTDKIKTNKVGAINYLPRNGSADENKISKKYVDDYISKQFENFMNNLTKTKNVEAKRKRIEVKFDKKRKLAKILIDSKGIKKYSFHNVPESTKVTDWTTIPVAATTTPVAADKLVFSDSIIDKIAKSVKSMVIEDLRKEFQPLRYQPPTNTTIQCCQEDNLETTTATLLPTTEGKTTTYKTTLKTTSLRSTSLAENPLSLLTHNLKNEQLMALEKFLEIFGFQNQYRPVVTSSTAQPAIVNYPYSLQPFQKGYPVDFNDLRIKHSDPLVLFKPIYGQQQNINPQYNSNGNIPYNEQLNVNQQYNNNNKIPYIVKPKLVFTLQSDIGDIPPLRIPHKGVFQNIIVTTKSPESSQNAKQRWWKSKRLPYPFETQATTVTYDQDINFQSPAPIRMSKGKIWGPMYEKVQANNHPRRPAYSRPKDKRLSNVAKYHQLLEFGPEYTSGFERPDVSQNDGVSQGVRQQQPLTHKKIYNEAPFKKILQTQQKVKDMLETILEMNKYTNIHDESDLF